MLRAAGALAGATLSGRSMEAAGQASRGEPVITLVAADYVRYMHIANGDVKPEGFTLRWLRGDRTEAQRRVTQDPAVDGGENSLAQHVMRVARGDRSLVAIPIFPLRNFTARDAYVAKGSTLTPETMEGKRIGIYGWAASGAVWKRHMIRWHGQDPAKITWIVGDADNPSAGTGPAALPPHVSYAPKGNTLTNLLDDGVIEAMMVSLPPKRFYDGSGRMVRLQPDYREAELKYFRETKCFPPQHAIMIRKATWDKNPRIGKGLVDAFAKADDMFTAAQKLFPYNSPWLIDDVELAERELGPRPYAPGLEANRHVLDVFCESAFKDGMTPRRVTVEEMFAEFLAAD
jgi:4,5-dihydroxyphthalate decarboxylase